MGRTKKNGPWSYITGEKGRNRVRVFQHRSGNLMVEYRDRGKRRRKSLRHCDRAKAKMQADKLAADFAQLTKPELPDPTIAELFDIYVAEVTPGKGESQQRHDRRTREIFTRFFEPDRRASTLSRRDWDRFILARRAGGLEMGTGRSKPVGDRTIERDLRGLSAVLNWAADSKDRNGNPLLQRNPLKGLKPPKEESPDRPTMTQERYERMLDGTSKVDWRFGVALVLCHETGHRIGAVRQLQWDDIDLEGRRIRWRKDSDKMGREHWTIMTAAAHEAFRRARLHSGAADGWVLPGPTDPSKPARKEYMDGLWSKAEQAVGLEPVKRMKWHSLRRKFATDLKSAPLKDLAHLGGWKSERTILECYQQPPDEDAQRGYLERRSCGLPVQRTPDPTPGHLRPVK